MDTHQYGRSSNSKRLVYTRNQLIALRKSAGSVSVEIPKELFCFRGRRAGIAVRTKRRENKWKFKPSVPAIVMGNVNSLVNKTDELAALVKNQKLYREASLICLTETWLTQNTPNANVDLPGFSTVRLDRDKEKSGKKRGGGLVVYINNRWCSPGHVTVKETICSKDVELLAVSLRPYYVPREFTHAIILCVYVPPRALPDIACDVIHSTVARLQTQHADAFFAISGDFNHVTLNSTLTNFHQLVDCNTRKNRTIDLLYSNVRDAYISSPLPPLGCSDHNLIHLQPVYKPKVQRLPITTRTVRMWTPEAEEALRDCFESTDWSVLQDHGNLEEITECTTDYLNFCRDVAVPTRTVRCYPNHKPWVTRDVKELLDRKKKAFKDGNAVELKGVQKELKERLKEAKNAYGRKIEMKMDNNPKELWRGLKTMTGCEAKSRGADGDCSRADDLNSFYNRFNCPGGGAAIVNAASNGTDINTSSSPYTPTTDNFTPSTAAPPPLHLDPALGSPPPRTTSECSSATTPPPVNYSTHSPPPLINHQQEELTPVYPPPILSSEPAPTSTVSPGEDRTHSIHTPPLLQTQQPLSVTADQVRSTLKRLKVKVSGPDGVCAKLLKTCAEELALPLQFIFNRSLQEGKVPIQWKTSCLIPVPKKPHPKELNDFRPVALTSHIMKTFERVLLSNLLKPQVHHALDPLQFAYQENVGVEDAILYLLHRVHSHLDKRDRAVRIMFFDFSSAFNTIQPLMLKDKLLRMGVGTGLVTWITDYLTGRPQFVRLCDHTSQTVVSNTGAPQGTVLSPVLFTLYTSDFSYNTETCHMQKFSDDTAIMACIKDGQEGEYREVVENFVRWCRDNQLQLNATKTKEMVVDFRRTAPPLVPVSIEGETVETVNTYKYLGGTPGQQTGLGCKFRCSLQERTEQALLPKEAEILQCLQQATADVLSVCHGKCPNLCYCLLGR